MFFNIKKLLTAFKPILFLQISKALPKKKIIIWKNILKININTLKNINIKKYLNVNLEICLKYILLICNRFYKILKFLEIFFQLLKLFFFFIGIIILLRGKAHAELKITKSGERRTLKDDHYILDEKILVWGKGEKFLIIYLFWENKKWGNNTVGNGNKKNTS